ncbi:MAG: hypothetical protein JF606_24385 [Burkholderiales bacterium]|jgi:hypothetical protein|nr:hypothetical protein [Burkholderiales bacterium]
MTPSSIVLVGVPDSGKTNYIGRLWTALRARKGRLLAPDVPTDIEYVEDTVAHLMQGEFAPRSEKMIGVSRRDFVVPVVRSEDGQDGTLFDLVVPDVSGELWKLAVETFEIPQEWMDQLKQSVGALLFVRVLSEHNVQPLDWINAEKLLKIHEPGKEDAALPTQVVLCELLRFLEHTLRPAGERTRPRVAVVVTAWDQLDRQRRNAGPLAYLQREYPLFAGRLQDMAKLDVRVFGVSVVGGDFDDPVFKDKFLSAGDLQSAGYCVVHDEKKLHTDSDLTSPVAWLIERQQGG